MSYSQRNQALLALAERSFSKYRAVPLGKLLPQFGHVLAHIRKMREVFLVIVTGHD
jgi:hypothetical protein